MLWQLYITNRLIFLQGESNVAINEMEKFCGCHCSLYGQVEASANHKNNWCYDIWNISNDMSQLLYFLCIDIYSVLYCKKNVNVLY